MSTQDSDIKEVKASLAGYDAVQTAKEAAVAQEHSRHSDSELVIAKVDERLKEYNAQNKVYLKDTIVDVLENVFGKEQSTYVVKNRVPLLCQAVIDIRQTIIEVKDMISDNRIESDEQHKSFLTKESFALQFDPLASTFKWIVMGVSSAVGLALLAAFFSLVLK